MFTINSINGQFYYDLFYFLAIVFAGIIFLYQGYKKNYPMSQWTLIFSSGVIFLIIGTKLFSYHWADWQVFFQEGYLPFTEKKTILGGIALGTFGIILSKRILRFNHPVLDELAISFPIAMGIQRIGCFIVGCCHGTTTDVPWAISYGEGTPLHYIQAQQGLIDSCANQTTYMHPSQLYQTILCFFIAFIIWKNKNQFKKSGNLFLFSISLYLILRIVIEFWRAPQSNGWAGEEIHGLKTVQWILIVVVPLLLGYIFYSEKKQSTSTLPHNSFNKPYLYFIMLSCFVYIINEWFTPIELYFIQAVLLPAGIYYLLLLLKKETEKYRFLKISSLTMILLFNGILTAQQSYADLTSTKESRNIFNDISVGYGNYVYSHYHYPPQLKYGCLGSYYENKGPKYVHTSHGIGLGLTHMKTFGEFQKLTLKAETTQGWDSEKDSTMVKTNYIGNFSAVLKYDFRWFGFGIGFFGGRSVYEEKTSYVYHSSFAKTTGSGDVTGSIRLFPYDIFYIEGSYNKYFPMVYGHRSKKAYRVTLGTGGGLKNGSFFETGFDFNGGLFAGAKAIIKNRFGLEAYYYLPVTEFNIQMFQISLVYRFNKPFSPMDKIWKNRPDNDNF